MVDDYAWLKDAKWQEVLRNLALLDPDIQGLPRGREPLHRDVSRATEDAAEDTGRRDARPHQGRRFECAAARRAVRLFVEVPRRRPARSDRTHAARRRRGPGPARRRRHGQGAAATSISAARAIRRTIASKRGAPTSAARSSSPSACATGRPAPTCADVIEQTSGSVVWGLDSDASSTTSGTTTTTGRCTCLSPSAGHAAERDDALVYAEPDNGWFVRVDESASAASASSPPATTRPPSAG